MLTVTMNPSLDVSTSTARLTPADKLRCTTPTFEAGGGGINVARVVTRFGVPVTAVVPLGGPTGSRIRRLLSTENIPVDEIPIEGASRQSMMVAERDRDQNFRFVLPGPALRPDELDAIRERVVQHDQSTDGVVVLSGSLPPGVPAGFYRELARRLRDAGARIIGDGSGQALRELAGAPVSLLKPSRRELAGLAGDELTDRDALEAAARQVLGIDGGAEAVLVSLGAEGAGLFPRDGETFWLRGPSVTPVSAVGAGDSMVAAAAVALSQGSSLVDAAVRGVAAGTAAVLTPGSELCRPADVERLAGHIEIERA